MKSLRIMSWCLICVSLSLAQGALESDTPPGIVILKLAWSKDSVFPSPPDGSPNGPPIATRDAQRPPRSAREMASPKPYRYAMKFKNDGAKALKAVAWDYLFLDPQSKKELGRHQFVNYQIVGSKKSATFEAQSPFPPAYVVSVAGLEKNQRSPFLERASIKCVLYSDETLWERPEAKGHACEDLRHGKLKGEGAGRR